MPTDLKSLIVTGAAGALGAALSTAACARGWRTVMVDRDAGGLERVYDAIGESVPGEPVLFPMDLAGVAPDEVDDFIAEVGNACGGLDALVHCAVHFNALTPLEHIDPVDWLMHMQVNVNAAWLLSARALPLLREAAAGRIVFLLEDLEKVGGALWGAYGVSKHALAAIVRQLAAETRSSSVQVRGVNPGPMRSTLRTRVYHSENPRQAPDPAGAAGRIMDFLEGRDDWPEDIMDLGANG